MKTTLTTMWDTIEKENMDRFTSYIHHDFSHLRRIWLNGHRFG